MRPNGIYLAAHCAQLRGRRGEPIGIAAIHRELLVACYGLIVIACVVAARRRRPRPLRRCPICAADAIVAGERDALDGVERRVTLRCGQCGTWRRLLTTEWALRQLDRDLANDRRAIGDCVARLQVERTLGDIDAFVRAPCAASWSARRTSSLARAGRASGELRSVHPERVIRRPAAGGGCPVMASLDAPSTPDTAEGMAWIAPDPAAYPDADLALLVPGSLVFHRLRGPVDLSDYRAWWAYVPGANWRQPEGPGSDVYTRAAPRSPARARPAAGPPIAPASGTSQRLPFSRCRRSKRAAHDRRGTAAGAAAGGMPRRLANRARRRIT